MARRKTVQRDPSGRIASTYEEEEEEDAILRDGQSFRVPLYMRDGIINPDLTPTQRGKAMHQTEDAAARKFGLTDGLQLHRPGFRYNTDAAAVERSRQAYADAEAADANAWRDTASVKPSASSAADPGNSQRKGAATDARAEAYRAYDEEMQNAWRGRK